MNHTRLRAVLSATTLALAVSGCSLMGTEDGQPSRGQEPTSQESSRGSGEVVVASHESFTLPKKLTRAFERETGYTIKVRAAGDAGTLATKLSLTAGNPIGDVAFGIDNTFASRPLDAGAFAPFEPTFPGPEEYQLDEGSDRLTAIDHGSVCVNADLDWFKAKGQQPPTELSDLADAAYRGLFVTPGASTSSPGMAFFLATVAEFGDDWPAYWEDLLANDTKIVDGWEDAYYGDFTAGSDTGKRPLVVSYDSSPAFTVEGDRSTTGTVFDTCFRQVEYAGVLEGADNPAGAEAFIEWLLTDEVQSRIPELMYMFPVSPSADVPEDWARYALPAQDPYEVSPEEIAAQREQWLTEWTDLVSR